MMMFHMEPFSAENSLHTAVLIICEAVAVAVAARKLWIGDISEKKELCFREVFV